MYTILTVIGFLVFLVAFALIGSWAERSMHNQLNTDLQSRVDQLNKDVARLEREIATLKDLLQRRS